jgi:outer membrane protein assembly factor BamB
VLWGEKLFITAADDKTGTRHVLCLNTNDGQTIWSKEIAGERYKMHARNSTATATPCVDEQTLYVTWGTPREYLVIAFDHDGNERWRTDLGPFKSGHGFGPSSIVFEDLLIVPNDHDGNGELVALDKATGKVRWKTARHGKNATFSTPCVYQPAAGEPELVFTNWQHGVTSIRPQDGSVNWDISVFEVNKQERAIGSPVVAGDLVIACCGFAGGQKHLVAVRPDSVSSVGKRTPQTASEIWRQEKGAPHMPTPLVTSGRILFCSDQGIASSFDVKTGKQIWQQRVGGNFSASPVCSDHRLFCVADDGQVVVLDTGDDFKILARNDLGSPSQTTPAIANHRIYFRTSTSLIALGSK